MLFLIEEKLIEIILNTFKLWIKIMSKLPEILTKSASSILKALYMYNIKLKEAMILIYIFKPIK